MKDNTGAFYAGVLSALAVVVIHDEETIFREIVDAIGEEELIRIARRDRAMRWSGLSYYGYGHIPKKRLQWKLNY